MRGAHNKNFSICDGKHFYNVSCTKKICIQFAWIIYAQVNTRFKIEIYYVDTKNWLVAY